MDTVFGNMDIEKKKAIINSSLDEFSNHVYSKASTNNIVKNAGISKGLLYHYFRTKQDLYDYLIEFVFLTLKEKIEEAVNWNERDLLKRIKDVVKVKLRILSEYPELLNFSKQMIANMTTEELIVHSKKYSLDLLSKIYHKDIDYTLFKDGTDLKMATEIIVWTLEKCSLEIGKANGNKYNDDTIRIMIEKVDEYLEFLKNTFYK